METVQTEQSKLEQALRLQTLQFTMCPQVLQRRMHRNSLFVTVQKEKPRPSCLGFSGGGDRRSLYSERSLYLQIVLEVEGIVPFTCVNGGRNTIGNHPVTTVGG